MTRIAGFLVVIFLAVFAFAEANGGGSRGGGGGVFVADGSLKFISILKPTDHIVDRDFSSLSGAAKDCAPFAYKPFALSDSSRARLTDHLDTIKAAYPDFGAFLEESINEILSETILIPYSLDQSRDNLRDDRLTQIALGLQLELYTEILLSNAERNLPNRQVVPPDFGGKSDGRRSMLDWVGMPIGFRDFDGRDRRWPEFREAYKGVPVEQQHTVVYFAGSVALVSEPLIRKMDDESLVALFLHEGLRFMYSREISNKRVSSNEESSREYLDTIHEAVPLLLSLDQPARLAQLLPKAWLGKSGHFRLSASEKLDYQFIKYFYDQYAPLAFSGESMARSCANAPANEN